MYFIAFNALIHLTEGKGYKNIVLEVKVHNGSVVKGKVVKVSVIQR
jgi:hypothetical protein